MICISESFHFLRLAARRPFDPVERLVQRIAVRQETGEEVRHSRMLLAGIQETFGPDPDKAIRGDDLGMDSIF
jgi:hypothetical protein